jgi:hypothetical protein
MYDAHFGLLDRRSVLALIGGTALAASIPLPAAKPLTLAEVVRRNTRARGGAAPLDRMRSIGVDVEIVEGGQTLNGHYAANKAGLVRIDVYAAGKHVGSEGVDANGVWILGKNGPEPSVATGARNALTHGAENHLFGWNRFPQRGHKLALMPAETIDGTTYQVVEVRFSTGHVSYFYVDPVSWQAVRRRDERAYHPDVSQAKQRVESRFTDFRSVGGIVAAHRNEDYDIDRGKLLSTNRVLARRINPGLSADYFDRNRKAAPTW